MVGTNDCECETMFKNTKEMLNASQLLYKNRISYIEMTPHHVTVKESDMEIATTLLSGFDVGLEIDKGAVRTAPTVKREVKEVSVGFHDLLEVIKFW